MDNFTFHHFEKRLDRIEQYLIDIKKEITKMASTQADLDTAIKSIGTLVTNDDAVITQLLGLVQSIITKVGGSVDLTTEVTALTSIQSTITTQADQLQTAITNLKSAGA